MEVTSTDSAQTAAIFCLFTAGLGLEGDIVDCMASFFALDLSGTYRIEIKSGNLCCRIEGNTAMVRGDCR